MKPKTIDSIINSISFSSSRCKNDISPIVAKQQLIELFMSCVPDENHWKTDPEAKLVGEGWNDCRDQMIKNLEKLK